MGCAKPGRGICEKKYCFSVLNRSLTTYQLHGILIYGIISITSFAVALAWPLNNPAVTAPVIGPRTREQFTGICRCSGTDLNLMKLASSSSPSLSSICKTSTKGYINRERRCFDVFTDTQKTVCPRRYLTCDCSFANADSELVRYNARRTSMRRHVRFSSFQSTKIWNRCPVTDLPL